MNIIVDIKKNVPITSRKKIISKSKKINIIDGKNIIVPKKYPIKIFLLNGSSCILGKPILAVKYPSEKLPRKDIIYKKIIMLSHHKNYLINSSF